MSLVWSSHWLIPPHLVCVYKEWVCISQICVNFHIISMKIALVLFLAVLGTYIATSYASEGRKFCSKPRIPPYGHISKGRKSVYKVGHSIQFACRRGYSLVGSSWIKCLKQGTRLYWNRPIPICKKICMLHIYKFV